jgi:hypothetical protein
LWILCLCDISFGSIDVGVANEYFFDEGGIFFYDDID